MTEEEIKEIFVQEMTDQNTNTALVNSYYRVLLTILAELSQPFIDPKHWKLLEETAYAKSRLCLFMSIENGSHLKANPAMAEDLVFLYRHWLKIISYLYNNYQNIDCSRFKMKWSTLDLFEIKQAVNEKYFRVQRQLQQTKSVSFNSEEMPIMDLMFNLFLLVILKEETMEILISESNQSFSVLRKYQKELIPA